MKKKKYDLKSEVWVYPGQSAWRFVSVDRSISAQIKKDFGMQSRGWGSIPVSVKIGKTAWNTSIFPDKKSGEYLVPLKSSVRKAEGIFDQTTINFTINIKI